MMSKYILSRVAEMYGYDIDFTCKPVKGDFNGSGMHTNYSTVSTRTQVSGYESIMSMMKKLELKHEEHMEVYGQDNHLRMTGLHETSSFDSFSYGVANRGCSVRIPRETSMKGYGYFEDRRPNAMANPYEVCAKLAKTTIL